MFGFGVEGEWEEKSFIFIVLHKHAQFGVKAESYETVEMCFVRWESDEAE